MTPDPKHTPSAAETAAQATAPGATVAVPVERLRYLEAVERAAAVEHEAARRMTLDPAPRATAARMAAQRTAYRALHAALDGRPEGGGESK